MHRTFIASLVEAMKTTHRRLYAVHSGKEPPVSQKAKTQEGAISPRAGDSSRRTRPIHPWR
jgi:hypothetical protein